MNHANITLTDRPSAAAATIAIPELPNAQRNANDATAAIAQRFVDEADAVCWHPEHPTLTWCDYRETERVERAMQAAWGAFQREMGRAGA